MEFTRGNLALKDHLVKGKRVFLFESEGNGYVSFVGEVECFDADYFETRGTTGKIILSNAIEKQAYEKIGVDGTEKISKLSMHNLADLDRYREHFGLPHVEIARELS